jgi:hypothetical protein
MILAAAACAAAGISYIFNDDEQSTKTKYETVTVSSTIIDKQGIVKYVIQPRVFNPYLLINQEQKGVSSLIRKYQSNHWILPIENKKQKDNSKEFSVVFFWSVPLKARLLQLSTKPCLFIENSNPFQRNLMKISIGTQNKNLGISPIPSEIALSYSDKYSYQSHKEYDDTLDSLSYNPMINDNVIPIGILKKKKSELDERENHQKRFCFGKLGLTKLIQKFLFRILDSNEEKIMRNMIFKNVNLCVENLSKILSESCSNSEEELTTLQKTSSLISAMNNNNINSRLFEVCEQIPIRMFCISEFRKEDKEMSHIFTIFSHLDIDFFCRFK